MQSPRVSLLVGGTLLVLLVALASLQYRWIAQLSEAERARLQEGLDLAAESFCKDFDREVSRAFDIFGPGRHPGEEELPRFLADRLSDWRSTAVWPEMVKELVVVRNQDPDGVALLCFDEGSQTLPQCDPDDEWLPIRRGFGNRGPGVPAIDGAIPGLILAIQEQITPDGETPFGWRPPRDHLVIRFDLRVITEEILPQLADTYFRINGGLGYFLAVSSGDRPGETIFQTDTQTPPGAAEPDATELLFGLRSLGEFSHEARGVPRMRMPPPSRPRPGPGAERPPHNRPPPELRARTEEGHWVLTIHHPAGSLERVIQQTRRRNMAISLATLALLGVTAVLMLLSTRRAQRLARQQMDFVAAVSHELRTPLTAIRSAGQNLADGIVVDPEKVQSYGTLIEREGRRLTEMIGRVLTFAGIRSGRQIYRMEPVDIGDIVRAALEDGSWVLEDSGFVVETEIADHLPRVHGDAVALRQVVTNLIDNALKYAADGRWLDLQVGFESGSRGGDVRISVADHGPGIPRKELAAIFEPFHRGADAGSSIPGSGLGLAMVRSIVKAHGGEIEVASSSPGGAVFTVRLPAVPEQVTERGEQR